MRRRLTQHGDQILLCRGAGNNISPYTTGRVGAQANASGRDAILSVMATTAGLFLKEAVATIWHP